MSDIEKTSASSSVIKEASAHIVERLEADAHRAIETVFIVGSELSRIRKAVEDPACGYEGRNPDQRYGNAVEKEILSVGRALHTIHRSTLHDYRTIYETFEAQRERVVEANVSQRKLLAFAKASDPVAALDAHIANPSESNEDKPKSEKQKPKADKPGKAKSDDKPASNEKPKPDDAETKHKARESERVALQLIASGVELPKTDTEIMNRTGVSKWVAAEVAAFIRGFTAASEVNLSEIQKMAREQIYAEVIKDVQKKIDFAENYHPYIYQQNYAFTQAEYNRIIPCLHPDIRQNVDAERLDEAFRLFRERKAKLMLPDKFVEKAAPRMSFDEFEAALRAKAAKGKSKKPAHEGATP